MLIAMATANFFSIPFEQALAIIQKAGFEYVELDGYWKGGGHWEAAQHLRDIRPQDAVKMVADSGLKIASFHDMGGVIEDGVNSIISPLTYEYLERVDIPCLIFHTPHRKTNDAGWWDTYRQVAGADLVTIRDGRIVCVENLANFPGYVVPLLAPEDMRAFVEEAGVYATLDTTHHAQCATDISLAAAVLGKRVKTVHLSDYMNGRSHVFIGDGELDFQAFYSSLDLDALYLSTIECDILSAARDEQAAVDRARQARELVARLTAGHAATP